MESFIEPSQHELAHRTGAPLVLAPPAKMPSMAKTILVVEDERVVARDIQRSLSDLGYNVPATAASAEDALRIASEHRPNLVLMDIRIKGEKDGIETAELLRQRFDVPIVYLTAYTDEPTITRAKLTEPFGYLLKPVKTNELRVAVEIALFKYEVDKTLRERAQWLSTTMRSIADAIISTDPSGRITYMNPEAERLTGCKVEEARGRPADQVLRLVDERSRSAIPNPLAQAVREARGLSVGGVLIGAGGNECLVADSTAPILTDTGSLLGAVMVFRDVGAQRELERRLEMSERFSALRTIAAFVHEINNPLGCVTLNLAAALADVKALRALAPGVESLAQIEELEGALTDAQTGAQGVSNILLCVKDLDRNTPKPHEQTQLNDVVEMSLRVASCQLKSRVLVVRRFGEAPRVEGSPGRLEQVFVNLLVNAAHALDPLRYEENELVVTTGTDEHGRGFVEIRDNGCGMRSEVMSKVFEPFFTTKPADQGTGLGLTVSHEIVRSLGGTLAFQSEPGKGTTARVTLQPCKRGKAPA